MDTTIPEHATPREQQLLDAVATAGYKPGDRIVISHFARVLKISPKTCSAMVQNLSRKMLWPYEHGSEILRMRAQKSAISRIENQDKLLCESHAVFKDRAKRIREAGIKLGRNLVGSEIDAVLS